MSLSGATAEATNDQFFATQSTRGSKRKLSRLLLLVSHRGTIVSKQLIICHTGLDVFVLAPTGMGKVFANECQQILHYIS
jgi:hypothetical protein